MNKYHESVNVLIPRPSYKGYHKGLTENHSRAQTFLFSEKNFEIWLKEIQIRRESSWQEKFKSWTLLCPRFIARNRPGTSDFVLTSNFCKKLWIYQKIFMIWQLITAEHLIFTDRWIRWIYSKIMSVLATSSEKESFYHFIVGVPDQGSTHHLVLGPTGSGA